MITMPARFLILSSSLLLLAACGRNAAPVPTPPPPEVTVVTIKAEPITLTRELPGRTRSFLVAEVRPQVTGIVTKQLFEEGSMVEAGQPLYQLDDSTYRADFNRAKATLARAQASLELARLNAERSAELSKVDAVSRQDYENATAALQEAEADVGVAEATAARAEVILHYSRITSPISGRIGKSSVTQGALVTENQPAPLATVHQLDPIYVDVTQSSRELLDLRRDLAAGTLQRLDEMPVTILLEDGTAYTQTGRLAFTEMSVDPTTGTFSMRVVVPNDREILLPGMYVRAVIGLGVREQAILVPQQGIARDPRGDTTATVIGANDIAEIRPVTVSRTIGDKWLVESGLNVGDRVIIEGLQKVAPGAPVQFTEAAATPVAPAPTPPPANEPAASPADSASKQ